MPTIACVQRPTREQLLAANGKFVHDVIARELDVLFCGINPGLYSAAVGHHFARPGNRFWPALHRGGFTPRLFSSLEEGQLIGLGCGITNIVQRATAGADELAGDELREGGKRLRRKVQRYSPRFLAILGVGAFREAFGDKAATIGPQSMLIGKTRLWVLPNPSGLNAHYRVDALGRLFAELRAEIGKSRG